jgi:membrane protease YdiL (CAAX protease family)
MGQVLMTKTIRDWRPWVTSVVTMVAITALSRVLSPSSEATGIAAAFLIPVWWWVWRNEDAVVRAHGLGLGGLMLHDRRHALAGFGLSAIVFLSVTIVVLVPYALVYRWWRNVTGPIQWAYAWHGVLRDAPGQLLMVALPEEVFFRGYLQTALDRQFVTKVRIFGAEIGLGLLISSAIFAVGHVLTRPHPERLAVFVPSLLFGWMRARTSGVGAPIAFHAVCNLLSAALLRGLTPA